MCARRQLERPVEIHEAMKSIWATSMLLKQMEELFTVRTEQIVVDHDVVSVDILSALWSVIGADPVEARHTYPMYDAVVV